MLFKTLTVVVVLACARVAQAAPYHAVCAGPITGEISARARLTAGPERLSSHFTTFAAAHGFRHDTGTITDHDAGTSGTYWALRKSFEAPDQFLEIRLDDLPGGGVYAIELRRCLTKQSWREPWLTFLEFGAKTLGLTLLR